MKFVVMFQIENHETEDKIFEISKAVSLRPFVLE